MTERTHQVAVEALRNDNPTLRTAQAVVEVIVRLTPPVRVYQAILEIDRTADAMLRTHQAVVEVVGRGLTYYNPCYLRPPQKPFGFVAVNRRSPCTCRQRS